MTREPAGKTPHPSGAADGPSTLDSLWSWLRGILRQRNGQGQLRESLEELIDEYDETRAPVHQDQRHLLRNVLNLHDRTVADVMVPRADIVAVEVKTPLRALIKLMSDTAHSRLPVYRDTLDDVVGMVHIKDVLPWWDKKEPVDFAAILRKVLFVAPSMRVLDLLLQMRLTRVHLALAVDEYGGIDGLVTIEDLVEEIVGEIEDEHDRQSVPSLAHRPDGSLVADARTTLEEFEAAVGKMLTEEERKDIDTLGGLVSSLAGRVPGRGELVKHPSGIEFEVLEADPRRIRRLRVRLRPPEPSAAGAGG